VSRGGEALLVLNQELRYLHPWGIGAAVFYDVGNVFARVQDIDLTLRHSVGAGLRYESPIGMLRLDVGFPLNPRPGDRAYQWFFALGQAF
jgi:translocation and assembly module TamA